MNGAGQGAARDFDRKNVPGWTGPAGSERLDPWDPVEGKALELPADYVVDQTGTKAGAFSTVQEAVDQAIRDAEGEGAKHRRTIEITAGRYEGPVYLPKAAPLLTLRGMGKPTISARIDAMMPGQEFEARSHNRFARAHPSTKEIFDRIAAREVVTTGNSAVLRIESDGAIIADLRVENHYACDRAAAAPSGDVPDAEGRFARGQHQAVALHVAGADRVHMHGLELSGFQDTLYLQSPTPFSTARTCLTDCLVEGDVDFIFGSATGYFHNCTIRSRGLRGAKGWVTAPSTNIRTPFGFVFNECDFSHDGAEFGQNGGFHLGRQWFEGVRATPYGDSPVGGYGCHLAEVSRYDPPVGFISRQTLEAVGKCIVVRGSIGPHINPGAPWDGWNTPDWNPRYRPVQAKGRDFLTYLGDWLYREDLDFSDVDPDEIWLGIREPGGVWRELHPRRIPNT